MLLKPHIEMVLKQEAIPTALEVCQIKPVGLVDDIGDYAALYVVLADIG